MEEEIITNINQALKLILNGNILLSSINNSQTYFALKNDKVYIQNANSCYCISQDEFKILFNRCKFIIYQIDTISNIDIKKDEEYYGWDILKK